MFSFSCLPDITLSGRPDVFFKKGHLPFTRLFRVKCTAIIQLILGLASQPNQPPKPPTYRPIRSSKAIFQWRKKGKGRARAVDNQTYFTGKLWEGAWLVDMKQLKVAKKNTLVHFCNASSRGIELFLSFVPYHLDINGARPLATGPFGHESNIPIFFYCLTSNCSWVISQNVGVWSAWSHESRGDRLIDSSLHVWRELVDMKWLFSDPKHQYYGNC